MPVIKSAKKQMRQSLKRRARNFPVRSELKTTIKKMTKLIKEGKKEEAAKFISFAYKVIDTACKKNILHPNNAARRKSLLAKALNGLQSGATQVAEKVTKAAKPAKEKKEVKEDK